MWRACLGNSLEVPSKVANTFVKYVRALHSEPNAIKRDKIAERRGAPVETVSVAEGPQAAAAGYLRDVQANEGSLVMVRVRRPLIHFLNFFLL